MVPDYPAIARRYAEVVASGALPTNELLVLAAKRYLKMLGMAATPDNEFVFEPLYVVDYCRFAERCRHFESGMWEITQRAADGSVSSQIVLEPWQIWIESAIHGFRHRVTGLRLVKTVLTVVPRKSAKSETAAIAVLYDLCCSGSMAPEIPIAATTGKQADDTLFGDIKKMINADDELRDEFDIKATSEEIRAGDGRVFKLSSMGERQDGLNPSLAIYEEGHAGAASVYNVVHSSFGARPNQLERMISTAGYRPEGPGYELGLEAERILRGGDDDEDFSFFAAIYTLDPELYLDDRTKAIRWDVLTTDMALVERCNPMLDVSLDRVQIRQEMKKAWRRLDYRGEFARTRFNIWTGQGHGLIDYSQWAACYRDGLDLQDFLRAKCWLGVDLAEKLDMCAIGFVFELPDDVLAVFAKYYLPESSPTAIDPDMSDTFAAWSESGHLVLTEGSMADHDRVRDDVELFCDMFDVQTVACDPRQAHNTAKHLYDGSKPVVIYPNNAATITPPTDDLLARVETRHLVHDNNPVLNWNVQNVHGERKGNGSIMPRKDKPNSSRKIDGWAAITMANGVRMQPDEAKPAGSDESPTDIYRTRGIIGFDQIVGGT